MINIRTEGGRSGEVPDHSEAFLELFGADPRGTNNEPNWRAYNAQRRARGKNMKFSNDDDRSIMEGVVTHAEMDQKKRSLFTWAKERMVWFSTSKLGWGVGSGVNERKNGDINYVELDGRVTEDMDNNRIRGNYTTNMSNNYRSGWYNLTDHEFAVAKYGPPNKNNYALAEPNNYLSDYTTVSPQFDTNANTKVAVQMMRSATDGQKQVMTSAGSSEYTELAEKEQVRLGKKVSQFISPNIHTTRMDQKLIESMVGAAGNRNIGRGDENVRGVVESKRKILLVENANSTSAKQKNTRLVVENDQKRKKDFAVVNYEGLRPKENKTRRMTNANVSKIGGEKFESMESIVLKSANKKRLPKYKFEGDMRVEEFGERDRVVGRAEQVSRTRKMTLNDSRAYNYGS
jgi:hypothetical protein